MRVVKIDSKLPLKFSGPGPHWWEPEELGFIAGAALVHWAPALLYSAVTGEALPLYLILFNQALGVALGVLLYNMPPDARPPYLTLDLTPNVPRGAQIREVRKAA